MWKLEGNYGVFISSFAIASKSSGGLCEYVCVFNVYGNEWGENSVFLRKKAFEI